MIRNWLLISGVAALLCSAVITWLFPFLPFTAWFAVSWFLGFLYLLGTQDVTASSAPGQTAGSKPDQNSQDSSARQRHV